VSVEEVLQTDLVTVPPTATVATISETMASESVGTVVVVEDGAPLGIVTDRDLALALADDAAVTERKAESFLSDELETATSDVSVFEALDQMERAQIRRLPVVDDDGAIRGMVALDDVLVLLSEQFQSAATIIRAQSPRL
jgi:CBS domain-containing protein